MTLLRWEKQRDAPGEESWFAYSGSLMIGMIGQRKDGICWYSISAVNMKWVAKGSNLHVASLPYARRAVNEAWAKWLTEAGLQPVVA